MKLIKIFWELNLKNIKLKFLYSFRTDLNSLSMPGYEFAKRKIVSDDCF